MLLGSRVVRGPDWKTREDSDSVEIGFVGTIINVRHFQDENGEPLPQETVLVQWDTGEKSCCRAGKDGYHDLWVLDSAPSGVKFKGFRCDGCHEADIAGMRWQCAVCPITVNLCTSCYMNDVHDTNHRFVRVNLPTDKNGFKVGERSTSFKIPSRGIFPGAKVRTKKDMKCSWTCPVLIGGEVLDVVTWEDIPKSTVLVKWGELGKQRLRLGYEGEVDLELVEQEFAKGPSFYPSHLPVVSVGAHLRLISKIISCDHISNKEIVEEGENAINYLNHLLHTAPSYEVEGKAVLCRIKREIQELQSDIEKSEHIKKSVDWQKSVEALAELENEERDDTSPCDDLKDSHSSPTSEISLKNNFQNDNYSAGGTDTVDSGSADLAVVSHLVQNSSFSDGQQKSSLPRNERIESEVSETLQNISWIIRKFEKMTSCSIQNLSVYEIKSVHLARAPYVARKAVAPNNKKKATFNVTTTCSPKENSEKKKEFTKPYLSTSGSSKSMQMAPSVAKKEGAFTTTFQGNVETKFTKPYLSTSGSSKSMQMAPSVAKKQVAFTTLSQDNMETKFTKPYLSTSGSSKSMQMAPSVAKKQGAFTTTSQGNMETEFTKPYLSTSGSSKSMQMALSVAKKQGAFTTTSQGNMETEFTKPYLSTSGSSKSIQMAPSVAKKEGAFTTTSQGNMETEFTKPYLSTSGSSKSMQMAPSVAKKQGAFTTTSQGNMETEFTKPYLSTSGSSKSMQMALSVAKKQGAFTTTSQGNMETEFTKPYLSTSGSSKSIQMAPSVAKKEGAFTTTSHDNMETKFTKPYLSSAGNRRSIQNEPNDSFDVTTLSPKEKPKNIYDPRFEAEDFPESGGSQEKKEDKFGVITTSQNESPKEEEDSAFETREDDNASNYVSRLVHRFEVLNK